MTGSFAPRWYATLFEIRRKVLTYITVPIGALYTPLKEKPESPLLQYEPVTCKPPCRAVLNPFWYVQYVQKTPLGSTDFLFLLSARSICVLGFGYVRSVFSVTLFPPTTRTSRRNRSPRSFTQATPPSNTDLPVLRLLLRFSCSSLILAKRRTV